ncbi:MAG: hypothetical protein SFX73_04425 [Kofleriaceae bacterium]|nr:hypothetical protein [Kofleriaceae bacterium]
MLVVWRRAAWLATLVIAACGTSRLAEVDALPPGAECPAGGTVIRQGDDDNDDGELQEDEVETSEILCNGVDAQALVDSAPEPVGANCATGGTRVRTGVDTDHDGTLDDDEVQNIAYLCNTTPTPTLVSTQNEPPGANCQLGGVAVSSGIDLDHDGVLDPNEVTGTSYVCTGQVPIAEVVQGDFVLRNSFDQALLAGVKRVTGRLFVEPVAALPDIAVPNLEEAGSLYISKSFASIAFPRLEQAGLVEIKTTGSFPLFELPALTDVAGTITITGSTSAASNNAFQLPALTSVESIEIDVPGPSRLELDSLTELQSLSIENNPLSAIVAPELATVRDALQLVELPQLATLDLGALASARTIELRGLSALSLAQVQLGVVTHVPDMLVVERLPWSTLSPLAAVRSVGSFAAYGLSGLTSLDLPQLETAGLIHISGCSALTSLNGFANLTSATDITINGNVSLTSVTGFNQLDVASKLVIAMNPNLSSMTGFIVLRSVAGELRISESAITQLAGFAALEEAGSVFITENDELESVAGFASLRSAGAVALTFNTKLSSVSGFGVLESSTAFTLSFAGPITTLSMPQLEGDVDLRIEANVTSLAFPQVTSGTILITAPLTDLSGLEGLRDVDLTLSSLQLTRLELPLLESGSIRMQLSPELTAIDLPAFETGSLQFEEAPKLASIRVPVVRELSNLWIAGSQVLKSLLLPQLERIGRTTIQQNPLLENIEMPLLEEIMGNSVFVSAPRLPKCLVADIVESVGYTGFTWLVAPECAVIDRCALHTPTTATLATGASLDVVGRVRVPGVTDTTAGTDASVVMRYQVGRGPRGSQPTDAAWSWIDASPTPSWSDTSAVGFDEYRASMMFPVGSHDVAARFSGDGGRTWTTCDMNGSEDGYQVGNAGQVEAQ